MIGRNKIWEELKQAHANVLCIKWYNHNRRDNRGHQLFIAFVASGSSFTYLLNNNTPLIGSIITKNDEDFMNKLLNASQIRS